MDELDQPEVQPEAPSPTPAPAEAPAPAQPDAPAPAEPAPAQTEAAAPAQADGPAPGMKRVEGRDRETMRIKAEVEAEVKAKVASDYAHVVWAYGIIWAIFAIYGLTLWRRASVQKADLATLRAKQRKS